MEKYLIIIDLDGTLMLDFSHYDEAAVEYLRNLKAAGHIIMIATGRPLRSSYFVYEALGLDTPIVNYNGALITNPTDDAYPQTDLRVDRHQLAAIFDYAGDDLINVFGEIHDDIYVLDYNAEIHDFLHTDGGVLYEGPLQETLPDNPNGCLMFVKNSSIERIQKYVEDNFSTDLLSRYWSAGIYHIVEIYNKNVNKGAGLQEAMNYYHIDRKHTIAIGDGHNDIEMLALAGTAVAMANSHPMLLEHADIITTSFDDHGVLKFLKSFFETKNH